MSIDITEFLLARIAEDEAVARAAAAEGSNTWNLSDINRVGTTPEAVEEDAGMVVRGFGDAEAQHAVWHDPARVLADCAARRGIVELHGVYEYTGGSQPINGQDGRTTLLCGSCGDQGYNDFCGVAYPCETLRFVASVYRDHPDFDPAWGLTA